PGNGIWTDLRCLIFPRRAGRRRPLAQKTRCPKGRFSVLRATLAPTKEAGMKTSRRLALVLVALLAIAIGAPALTKGTGELRASTFLLDPKVFGDRWGTSYSVGWMPGEFRIGGVPVQDGLFRWVSWALYLGPGGSRIMLFVYISQPGRAALGRS